MSRYFQIPIFLNWADGVLPPLRWAIVFLGFGLWSSLAYHVCAIERFGLSVRLKSAVFAVVLHATSASKMVRKHRLVSKMRLTFFMICLPVDLFLSLYEIAVIWIFVTTKSSKLCSAPWESSDLCSLRALKSLC